MTTFAGSMFETLPGLKNSDLLTVLHEVPSLEDVVFYNTKNGLKPIQLTHTKAKFTHWQNLPFTTLCMGNLYITTGVQDLFP